MVLPQGLPIKWLVQEKSILHMYEYLKSTVPFQADGTAFLARNLVKASVELDKFKLRDLNGVVHIAARLLPQIIDILPAIISADELFAADVDRGVTFKKAGGTQLAATRPGL